MKRFRFKYIKLAGKWIRVSGIYNNVLYGFCITISNGFNFYDEQLFLSDFIKLGNNIEEISEKCYIKKLKLLSKSCCNIYRGGLENELKRYSLG